jgi:hypothetical protein
MNSVEKINIDPRIFKMRHILVTEGSNILGRIPDGVTREAMTPENVYERLKGHAREILNECKIDGRLQTDAVTVNANATFVYQRQLLCVGIIFTVKNRELVESDRDAVLGIIRGQLGSAWN